MEPRDTSVEQISCLVCDSATRIRHLGIGCRACTVFYRRTKARPEQYECRSGTERCAIDRDEKLVCKRCRYLRFEELCRIQDSVQDIPVMPALDRLRTSYETIRSLRVASELTIRSGFNNDLTLGDLTRATYETAMVSKDIEIKAHAQFVSRCFDEFDSFTDEEKWAVMRNCAETITILEHTFLTLKNFDDEQSLAMIGLTMYYDYDNMDDFFEGQKLAGEPLSTRRLLSSNVADAVLDIRRRLRATLIDETELIAAFGLELFNTTDTLLPISPRVASILDNNREQLLKDLHVYYKHVKRTENYAARLGELYCLIARLKSYLPRARENVEMWRLLLSKDDNSMCFRFYRMHMA